MNLGLKGTLDKVMARFGYVPASAPAPEEPGLGKRSLLRRRQQMIEGFMALEGKGKPYPVSVRDMNHFGSRIDLWDDVPARRLKKGLTLFIPCDGKEVDCDVAWVRGRSVGLRFRSPFREPTRSYT